MSEPLEVMASLDERVREYTATNLEREGIVTGWVLCVASTRFDDEGNTLYAYDYSCGPDTDLIRAVGLIDLARDRMFKDINPADDDD